MKDSTILKSSANTADWTEPYGQRCAAWGKLPLGAFWSYLS